MANFLNLTDGEWIIVYKEISSSEPMKVYYEDDSPKQFTTQKEATEYAIEKLGTTEFYTELNTLPVVNVP